MKKISLLFLFVSFLSVQSLFAQEKYGKTFNVGVGLTYYGYVGRTTPAIMLNYEIDVVKNFTLAPSIGFFTYRNYYNWIGYGPGKGNKYYNYYYNDRFYYRTTVVPIGVKGTYYFDDLLNANEKWDFYAAATLGFAIRSTRWEDDYHGDNYSTRGSSVYADLHIGTEYHVNPTIGLFADLSLGMLTLGLSVHHK